MSPVEPAAVLQASKRHASALAFTPEGRHLVTGGMEGALRVWRVGTWALEAEPAGHGKSVNTVSFGPLGTAKMGAVGWATGGSDQRVVLRSGPQGEAAATLQGYTGAWCSPLGRWLVLAKARSERLFLHDLDAGKVTGALDPKLKKVGWPAFLPDGRLAVGGFGAHVAVFDLPGGDRVATLEGHDTSVIGLAPMPHGKVVTSDYAGTVRVWDAAKGEVLRRWATGAKGYVFAAASPDGALVATTDAQRVRLWSAGGEALGEARVPVKGVYALAFSRDGTWLANAAADGRARVWRIAELRGPA